MSFQQVVHPVLTEEAEVAETSNSKGEPDERAQECPSDATRVESELYGRLRLGRRPKAVGEAGRHLPADRS